MQYRHFVVTLALILALVMASGCTGLLMGDLKAEISDSSDITIPPPLSSVLSVLARENITPDSVHQSLTREKGDTAFDNPLSGSSRFYVKSSTEDPMKIDTDTLNTATVPSSQGVEHLTPLKAPPGELVIPGSGTASCNPVGGAKVTVTLIGIQNKTHVADCITQENGDFSFDISPSMGETENTIYIINFEITAPGYNLPAVSSSVVTDLVYVSDGPRYTFNVCLQQPSEPNAIGFTRGGIAVIGRISS